MLSTEVAKVYVNAHNGQVNRVMVDALRRGLGQAMRDHSRIFLTRVEK